MPIRCLIIEDEPLPAQILEEYIAQTPGLLLSGHCTDAIYALDHLKKEEIDLIFLDIHLPKLKGLEFLNLLKKPPLVIITTAYHQYALEGYEYEIADYLMKPIGYVRFLQAVEKAKSRLVSIPLNTTTSEYLYFNVNRKQVKVVVSEIQYIESMKEYSRIHTTSQRLVTQVTLSDMEKLLPSLDFIRIHRSFIIHTKHLTAYTATDIEIGILQIPIGKTYVEEVMKRLKA